MTDTACTGTAFRDFIRVSGESRFDEQTVVDVYPAPPNDAMLVFGTPVGYAEVRQARSTSRRTAADP